MKPATKKIDYQGTDCYQPLIKLSTPYGTITHKMPHVLLTTRKDAMDAAKQWVGESIEAGYVTH